MMKFNDITKELALLGSIVDGWVASGAVSDLERDMVLDKLRNIYSEIKYGEIIPEVKAVEQELKFDIKPQIDAVPSPKLEVIAEPEPIIETVSKPEPAFNPEPEVIVKRPKVDRNIISTLYGDDQKVVKPVVTTVITPVEQPSLDTIQTKKILGEVIGSNGAAINEVLGRQNQHTDVASKIYTQKVDSLRHSIGVNDRFLLIRDLFRGDTLQYDATITALDGFTDFDDAMLYIQDNFSLESESASVAILVDLLERKLGL